MVLHRKKGFMLEFASGFTLVELLVAVAIVSILSAIVTANFTSARAKSRDTKRVSDIAQIQLSLEFFFDRCGKYPESLSLTENCVSSSGTTVSFGDFISTIPTPPSSATGETSYQYGTNSVSGSLATDYVIGAQLETNAGSVLTDDLDGTDGDTRYGIACDDATLRYCVGPK